MMAKSPLGAGFFGSVFHKCCTLSSLADGVKTPEGQLSSLPLVRVYVQEINY